MAESGLGDQYALPRNPTETERLNEQHRLLTQAYGFLIHPSVTFDKNSSIRIADIACGSGIWLTDLAAQYRNAQCDGFDISDKQFPTEQSLDKDLQGRVHFHVQDAAAESGYGTEHENQFDIVGVRLMHINITGSQWDQAVKNAASLLKPGGYLQWIDWDPRAARVVQSRPILEREGLVELIAGFNDFLSTRDTVHTNRMPQMMEANALDVRSESYALDENLAWRQHMLEMMVKYLPKAVVRGLIGKPSSNWDEGRLERVERKAQEEAKQEGIWIRFEIQCHVGRKAS